eukprot:gnl/MRDRNA2_/MRDRNA2_119889_c0_seq1.p1 gnl/MRDRNA2_/MRDRNA2_119889_c0~~gnl/MRDRNA2_/MRDRNA2_119889_c0_seq1.p1  ORF type:complete len:357 (-),score=76.22 gnl/MRDRNA2_/MRDRNA2_119889_c0_seq1:115-1185(-)
MSFVQFLVLFAIVDHAFAGTPLGSCSDEDINRLWDDFLQKFDKTYKPDDLPRRKANFRSNCQRALMMNKEAGKPVFGITKFSDLSTEEFRKIYLGSTPPKNPPNAPVLEALTNEALPESFDWRTKNAVTPVKNQGACGSCWAFSATETIESALILKDKKHVLLSPQQITSCAGLDSPALGCNGGWPAWAYAYVEKVGGITTAADYPYTSGTTGATGTCNKSDDKWAGDVLSFKYAVPPCNNTCADQYKQEAALESALANVAPISVCMDASPWMLYQPGQILSSGCPSAYDSIDHCIQLVGYNKEGATPYWIVRNSWGTDWGTEGYIYIEMGKNLCGIADQPTLVTVEPKQQSEFVI